MSATRPPSMTPDEFALAEAIALKRLHGDRIYVMVAERIGAMALAGDWEGVERFKLIAAKLEGMMGRPISCEQYKTR